MEYEENLLSVLSERNIETLLSPSEVLAVQGKLWEVLANRAESYTMGGSSSVRVETAQELLKSAGFVINHGLRYGGIGGTDAEIGPEALRELLLRDDFGALFKKGLEAIESQVREGERLLEEALRTATSVDNGAYRDTLRELGVFFKRYHYHHFAHDIPCMLDYPLARPVDEALLGIDYINEYLRRLLIENDLVGRFAPETVVLLLKSVDPNYVEILLNFYELVAGNALALTLLTGDVFSLDVTERDINRLHAAFEAQGEDNTASKLLSAAAALCRTLDIGGGAPQKYLAETAESLAVRVRSALEIRQLGRVFPPLYKEKAAVKLTASYVDGALMDDEKFRALIDTLTSCRFLSDKIALVLRNVRSLRDLSEILNICFWGDELTALFDALGGDALEQLRLFAGHRKSMFPEWRSETGWETVLSLYP